MTLHRFVYKVCWKRPFIPLLAVILSIHYYLQYIDHVRSTHGQVSVTRIPWQKEVVRSTHGQASITRILWQKEVVRSTHGQLSITRIPWQKEVVRSTHGQVSITRIPWQKEVVRSTHGQVSITRIPWQKEVVRSTHGQVSITRIPWQKEVLNWKPVVCNGSQRARSKLKFKPLWKNTPYLNALQPPETFRIWKKKESRFCNGSFVTYANEFVHLKFVKLDQHFCNHARLGGEAIQSVLNQPEKAEYFTYKVGFFQQTCKQKVIYNFKKPGNHLNDWLNSLDANKIYNNTMNGTSEIYLHTKFVLAIVRYEYVNLYHTMTDWYNAFLLMQFFNKTQWDTNVILFDTHPQGSLDPVWHVLFNSTCRLSMLPKQITFSNLVWSTLGYNSPLMDHYSPSIPLVEEFRDFFLSSFNITYKPALNCEKLNILFIWRRDYVAHPRNPSGRISRKIKNENALMTSVQARYPNFNVRGMQIDLFDMRKQLDTVARTDILIGMHGAGLTHTLFLPKHAGLVELYPNYWSDRNLHFYAMAKWRKLWYEKWVNTDPVNEVPNYYTKVPLGVLHSLLRSITKKMCPG